jgi:hypothetical protein
VATLLVDTKVLEALADQYGCTPAEANAKLQEAARDLRGSVSTESLPEMTIRLAAVRLTDDDPARPSVHSG